MLRGAIQSRELVRLLYLDEPITVTYTSSPQRNSKKCKLAVLSDAKFIKHEKNLWHEVSNSTVYLRQHLLTDIITSYSYSHVTFAVIVQFVAFPLLCSLYRTTRSLISSFAFCLPSLPLHLNRTLLKHLSSSISPQDLPAKIVSIRSPTNPLVSSLHLTSRKQNGPSHLWKHLHHRTSGGDLL